MLIASCIIDNAKWRKRQWQYSGQKENATNATNVSDAAGLLYVIGETETSRFGMIELYKAFTVLTECTENSFE